jgi:uncharacterized membrane protein YhaH (DUF805 family)
MNNNIGYLLFSFNGRIGRGPFWAVQGTWIVIYVILLLITQASAGSTGSPSLIVSLILLLFVLASIWPLLAVQIKRWHDRNKSGWWCLIGFVPIIGGLWALIECGCLPGVDEGNRFNA